MINHDLVVIVKFLMTIFRICSCFSSKFFEIEKKAELLHQPKPITKLTLIVSCNHAQCQMSYINFTITREMFVYCVTLLSDYSWNSDCCITNVTAYTTQSRNGVTCNCNRLTTFAVLQKNRPILKTTMMKQTIKNQIFLILPQIILYIQWWY